MLVTWLRMGGRAVECTGLEIRRPFTGSVGSNPTPSARNARVRPRDMGYRSYHDRARHSGLTALPHDVPLMAERTFRLERIPIAIEQ